MDTFDPEAGENAVIIQLGCGPLLVSTEAHTAGPEEGYPECTVRQTLQEEPEMVDGESKRLGVTGSDIYSPEDTSLHDLLDADKLGGVPCFIQYPEYSSGGTWHFLLQMLEYHQLPGETAFNPNFGCGQTHIFISEDGRSGRMLWQC